MSNSISMLRKGAMALALVVGAAQFAGSVPARAGFWEHGNGGDLRDWGADHDEIYQVQRGDMVCPSRQACGGAAAIPMNRPGWFYLPREYVSDPPPVLVPRHHHHAKRRD